MLGAIDTYKAALTISPDRADALSNLGAAYVRLGQFDDAIAQYEAALKSDPVNTTVRLNLALAYYKSARPNQAIPQLKRVVASDPQARERVSRARRLLPADRAGPGSRRAPEAARGAVRERPRVCLPARHGAAAHRRRGRGAEVRRSRVRRRRVRRSALADGHRASRPARLSGREDGAPARRAAQSAAPDRALAVRPCAAGARGAGRRGARLPQGARTERQRLRGEPAAREPAEGRAEVRGGVDLPRARDDRFVRPTSPRASCSPRLRLQTGQVDEAVADARSDRQGGARCSSKCTCSWRPPTTA